MNVTVCHCTDLAALTELIGCSVFRDLNNYRSTAGIIYELLLAKSGLGVISVSYTHLTLPTKRIV